MTTSEKYSATPRPTWYWWLLYVAPHWNIWPVLVWWVVLVRPLFVICEDLFPNDLETLQNLGFLGNPETWNSSCSWTASEPFRNSVFWIPWKLRIHLIPKQPQNPSENCFPCFLGFLRNSENSKSWTWKLNLFLFLISPDPWSFILSYLLVLHYS